MTLRQLRYVDVIAKRGSLTAAAEVLFVTQPSLTAALRELEQELGITLFLRSRKGLTLTAAGEEFLAYARQILDQVSLVEQRYTGEARGRRHFCVSSQHYSFAVEAFVALLNTYGGSQYEFHMRETETYRILEDVSKLRSEIGVLYRNQFNEAVLQRSFQEMKLLFTPLCRVKPHVFLGTHHPLTQKKEVSMEDLRAYPRLSYEQGQHNSFYFSEEIQSAAESEKDIVVCDRATLFNLLIGLDGYTIATGILNSNLNGDNIVSIPLDIDDPIELVYIQHEKASLSKMGERFIEYLIEEVKFDK